MNRIIDFTTIDQSDSGFAVSERGDFILIVPRKTKFKWETHELHLRSLLCRKNGEVVSAGMKKFLNYGEAAWSDAKFHAAMKHPDASRLRFPEKMDGSLVLVSFIDGHIHMRTRGNHDLGDFTDAIMQLWYEKYPKALAKLAMRFQEDGPNGNMTWLFEYVAPDNQIVIRYPDPELFYLGAVDLRTLEFLCGPESNPLDMPTPKFHELPYEPARCCALVNTWPSDHEGVVAWFTAIDDQRITLTKIKSDAYRRLHTLRFRMQGRVGKLAYLLGITTMEEAPDCLATLGVDFEAQAFIADELQEYCARYRTARKSWAALVAACSAACTTEEIRATVLEPKQQRKLFVQMIRPKWPAAYFAAAMKWYDADIIGSWHQVLAAEVLHESPHTVAQWEQQREAVINDMLLSTPDLE